MHGEVSNTSKAGTGHFCQRWQVTYTDIEAFAAASTHDRRLNSCSHYTGHHYMRDYQFLSNTSYHFSRKPSVPAQHNALPTANTLVGLDLIGCDRVLKAT